MATAARLSHLDVFAVENYADPKGTPATQWLKVGVAFPHKTGPGMTLQLRALPVDGKLVVLPPVLEDGAAAESPVPPRPMER